MDDPMTPPRPAASEPSCPYCFAVLGRGESGKSQARDGGAVSRKAKRVLVADDSLDARELQRKLLNYRGYDVEIAVDGIDAWYTLRTGNFDLVLADIDMPLMGGIELIRRMRKEPRLHTLAAVIVCDRDSEQDRLRGFEAGADYYVIRGTFHDTLLQTVASLIGAARS